MRLTPHEQERLLVHVAADVARGRQARGLRLNHPEAVAILTDWVVEANPALGFDRVAARGMRLDVPAGTSVRFEPGIALEVALVPIAGRRVVPGLRGEVG